MFQLPKIENVLGKTIQWLCFPLLIANLIFGIRFIQNETQPVGAGPGFSAFVILFLVFNLIYPLMFHLFYKEIAFRWTLLILLSPLCLLVITVGFMTSWIPKIIAIIALWFIFIDKRLAKETLNIITGIIFIIFSMICTIMLVIDTGN